MPKFASAHCNQSSGNPVCRASISKRSQRLASANNSAFDSITDPNPIDFLLHVMEARELSRKNLDPFIGSRARVAEVLNRVHPLTLDMIRRLATGLKIPADVLVRDYKLKRAA